MAIAILDDLYAHNPHLPCAKILCSGFANSKQLYRAIYNAAVKLELQRRKDEGQATEARNEDPVLETNERRPRHKNKKRNRRDIK